VSLAIQGIRLISQKFDSQTYAIAVRSTSETQVCSIVLKVEQRYEWKEHKICGSLPGMLLNFSLSLLLIKDNDIYNLSC